jgi:formylmethanofuran dehydrogenase subunit A
MAQHRNHAAGSPHKWVCMDIECDAGCGVVPFKYKDQNFVNALQWAIGLEIFLLVDDPWRIFLTTDHPNGAPFTSYPHLIKLLTDKTFRNEMFSRISPDAQAMSTLGSIEREYTLYEIAIMTRAGAAKLVGLHDRGHLGSGAAADITVYTDDADREKMFAKPDYVFKDGELVVRNGSVVKVTWGATHAVKPEFDRAIEKEIAKYYDTYHTVRMEHVKVTDQHIADDGRGHVRHARHHHRAEPQVGQHRGHCHDRLRHFRDCLWRGSRHRTPTQPCGNPGRPPRRVRADVRHGQRGADEAT